MAGCLKSRLGLAAGTIVVWAAPAGPAAALTTHTVTTSTPNTSGYYVAKPTCDAGEHVMSGGYSLDGSGAATTSRAVRHAWTVHASSDTSGVTAYAYCSKSKPLARVASEAVTSTDNHTPAEGQAECPSGKVLASGGYRFDDEENASNSPVYESDIGGNGAWAVTLAFSSVPNTFHVYAYCSKTHVDVHTAQSDIGSGSSGTASVECDSGEHLISGGYETTPTPDFFNSSGPDIFYTESKRLGTNGWTASGVNYSGVGGQIVVAAYCTS